MTETVLLGVPVGCGGPHRGPEAGPATLRPLLAERGVAGRDLGDVIATEAAGWVRAAERAAFEAAGLGRPVFLGGDHLMSAGTVAGVARRAAARGRPPFVLWLDAHADFHTLETTRTRNLHGTPLAYVTGQPGFADAFPRVAAPVAPRRVVLMGARSVDPGEVHRLAASGIEVTDLDDAVLGRLLARVRDAGGWLHVSLDVDVVDPSEAPGVGTPVPGGAAAASLRSIAEALGRSGLVSSLDLAELDPGRDEGGRTAALLADLACRTLGAAAQRERAA